MKAVLISLLLVGILMPPVKAATVYFIIENTNVSVNSINGPALAPATIGRIDLAARSSPKTASPTFLQTPAFWLVLLSAPALIWALGSGRKADKRGINKFD